MAVRDASPLHLRGVRPGPVENLSLTTARYDHASSLPAGSRQLTTCFLPLVCVYTGQQLAADHLPGRGPAGGAGGRRSRVRLQAHSGVKDTLGPLAKPGRPLTIVATMCALWISGCVERQ